VKGATYRVLYARKCMSPQGIRLFLKLRTHPHNIFVKVPNYCTTFDGIISTPQQQQPSSIYQTTRFVLQRIPNPSLRLHILLKKHLIICISTRTHHYIYHYKPSSSTPHTLLQTVLYLYHYTYIIKHHPILTFPNLPTLSSAIHLTKPLTYISYLYISAHRWRFKKKHLPIYSVHICTHLNLHLAYANPFAIITTTTYSTQQHHLSLIFFSLIHDTPRNYAPYLHISANRSRYSYLTSPTNRWHYRRFTH